MNIQNIIATFEKNGYTVNVHQNNHLRILRRRFAPFQGPRVVSYWPGSRRETAYDENLDASWAPATVREVLDAMDSNEDHFIENAHVVS